jgi:CelD/BcsL family acetyltransferase involved in cellulose biosynthesis
MTTSPAQTDGVESRFVADRASLLALRAAAQLSGLRPRQLEHDLLWLAETDHGDRCSAGALALYAGGTLAGYVPLRCRRVSLPLRVGEMAALRLPYRTIQLFGDAVLGDREDLCDIALSALPTLPYDFHGITLEETPIASSMWRAIERGVARDFDALERARATHWLIDLPASYEAYIAGLTSKTRNNLRRSERAFTEMLGRPDVHMYTRPEQAEELLRTVEQVIKKTFHYHLLGWDLTSSNRAYRKNLETWARHGWLRGYVLFGADRPLAYVIGYLVGRRYQYEQIAYDPDFARLAPGNHLLLAIVADLIHNQLADVLDFGRGDAEYKRSFGNRSYAEGAMLLTRRTMYARGAAGAERIFDAASRAAARSFDRLGIKGKVKSFLRRASGVRRQGLGS